MAKISYDSGATYSDDFSRPEYYDMNYRLPQLGLAGQIVQKMFPDPFSSGSYDNYMKQLVSNVSSPPPMQPYLAAARPVAEAAIAPIVAATPPASMMPANNFNLAQFSPGPNAQQAALAPPKMVQPETMAKGGEVDAALHAARRHFENGGDAPVIPPEFTSDTAGTPVDFRPLNFDALRQANAVRVTNRANPDGTTDTDPNAGFSIVSGWNDSMAQHGDPRSTVTWPDNPEAYGTVADMFANNPEWITPHKYRQILHSARELGMRDEDVYAQPRAHGGTVEDALHAVRQHFDEGGFLDSVRNMFSGPDYLSTGEVASPTNWGDPESAADFFKADRALRLAREVQAPEAPLTAPRPGPVQSRELATPTVAAPPPAPDTPVSFNAPERGVSMLSSDISPASITSLPLAYTAAPVPAPASAAISTVATPTAEKLTARAPQDAEPTVTNARILAAIRTNESRNNPRAQNPSSSAGGLYQFLNSTWGNTLRRMDPERFGAYSDRQLRGLKTDPNAVDIQHAAANYHLTNDIAPRLSKAGVPLTPGSAYLSWFQGPGGAVRAYTAPENATVAQVFPKTVSANANMRFNGKPYAQWTMSDLRQWADTAMAKRMGRAEGGIVDDALHVVREHHADGEAVGQAPEMLAEEPRPLTIYRGNAPVADEAGGSGREPAPVPAFSYMPTPESVARQATRQPAYNPAERTWSDAGSTEGERLTRALGVEGELPKGETFMSPQPTGWDKYKPQRRPGSYMKRWGEAFNENADAVEEGLKAIRAGNYGSGALGMVGGGLGMALSPLTGMERVLVRDPILQYTGDLKKAREAEMVADTVATGGVRGMVTPFAKAGNLEKLAAEPMTSAHRLPSPAATGAATAAGAMLAPEDAEAGNVDRILRGLRAYHGSPYKFDRFDLSKIGAGEGAQAFGHGLYFAEHEPTAKYYRDTLAHKGAIDLEQAAHERGLPLSIDAQREIRRQASGSMEPLAAAKWAQSANSEMRPFDQEKLADLIDTYRQSRTGHMYEVNINADPDRLLNWNKQLKEQPEGVVRSLQDRGLINMDENIGPSSAGVVRPLGWTENVGGLSGEKLYRRLIENQLAGFDRKGAEALASKELASAGVPGIKYLDAGSLNATGIPTHNYVIFNDKLIDINRRYAEGGQIPEGNDMRDHFEGGGLTSAALKLVRKAAQQAPAAKRLFPQVAERYPEMIPPVPTIDKRTGKEFPAKALGQEAMDVQKARAAAQKEINAGNYEPYFPIEQRFDVDPSNYPEINPNTSDLIRMKLPKAVAGYEAKARDPQALENLRTGFEHGLKQKDMAENWYYMGQLEAEFIKEYGPEMGRTLFKQRFPDAMAATTGGADPTSNLMMAHFGNYLHNLGEKMPTKAYEYPFPVAGGKYGIQGNMDQYRKMIMEGEGLTPENPKRYNFSANFLGKKTPTIDEQMSSAWDPKMASPPTGSYGHYEGALTDLSNSMGYDPRYFQEVGWAGIKDMKTPGGFKAQPMIGIVNEAIERTHQITGMPRDEIVRRGLVRAEIPLYGAAGATAAGAMGPEFMQGQGEAPAPEAAEAPMTEERKRGGSVVDRALMLVSRQA